MKRIVALALALSLLVQPAFAGGYCYSNRCYTAPVVKTVAPVTPNYTTTHDNHSVTYTYTINYAVPSAAQGNTLGGYGVPTVREFVASYKQVDPGELILRQQQLNESMVSTAAQATQATAGVVGEYNAGFARVAEAESVANGQTAMLQAMTGLVDQVKQAIASIKPSDSFVASRTYTAPQPTASATASATAGNIDSGRQAGGDIVAVVNASCIKCHSSQNKKGGLDLSDLSQLSPKQVESVLDRITTSDGEKRMPQGGPNLTAQQIATFFRAVQ